MSPPWRELPAPYGSFVASWEGVLSAHRIHQRKSSISGSVSAEETQQQEAVGSSLREAGRSLAKMRRCIEAAVLDQGSFSGFIAAVKMEIKAENGVAESDVAAAAAVEPAEVGSVLLRGVVRRWVAPTEGQLQATIDPAAEGEVADTGGSRQAVWRALRVVQRERSGSSGGGSENAGAVVEPGSVLLCELTAGGYLSQAPLRGEVNSGGGCALMCELRAMLMEVATAPTADATAGAAPKPAAADEGTDKDTVVGDTAVADVDAGAPQVNDEAVPETVEMEEAAAEPKLPMEVESTQQPQPAAAVAAAGGAAAASSSLAASERPVCEAWLELLSHLSAAASAAETTAATAAAETLLGAAQTGASQLLTDRTELLDDIATMAALGVAQTEAIDGSGGNGVGAASKVSVRVGQALAEHCEVERAALQRSLTVMGEAAQVLAEDEWWGQRTGSRELHASLASAAADA